MEEEDLICPITNLYFCNPAKLDCGHVFEFEAIRVWVKKSLTCPCCRSEINTPIKLTVNTAIQKEVRNFLFEHPDKSLDQFVSVAIIAERWKQGCSDKEMTLVLNRFYFQNIPINEVDSSGKTLLHYAVIYRKQNIVEQLLSDPSLDPNIIDHSKATPLKYAVISNHITMIITLIKHESLDFMIQDYMGETALECATDLTVLELLLPYTDISITKKYEKIRSVLSGCKDQIAIITFYQAFLAGQYFEFRSANIFDLCFINFQGVFQKVSNQLWRLEKVISRMVLINALKNPDCTREDAIELLDKVTYVNHQIPFFLLFQPTSQARKIAEQHFDGKVSREKAIELSYSW